MKEILNLRKIVIITNGPTEYVIKTTETTKDLNPCYIKSKDATEINIDLSALSVLGIEFEENSKIGETTLRYIKNDNPILTTVYSRPVEVSDELKDLYPDECYKLINAGYDIEMPIEDFKGLCFTAVEPNSTIIQSYSSGYSYQYSYNGRNWVEYDVDARPTITLENVGDKVYWRGNGVACWDEESLFKMTGKIAASGSIMSLIDGVGETTTIPEDMTFKYCFYYTPELVTAPELPATTLQPRCYEYMFSGTSLTQAPELPATTLTERCYEGMFSSTPLTQAPVLSATNLTVGCYQSMFKYCTSLEQAPVLPAPTLEDGCYAYMFDNCSNLNYIKVGATSWKTQPFWTSGVAETGTFVIDNDILEVGKNEGQIPYPSVNGIPQGWRIEGGVQPTPVDYKGLCFTAEEPNSTILLQNKVSGSIIDNPMISYDGESWQPYTLETVITLQNVGDKVYLKADRTSIDPPTASNYFVMTGKIAASGSMMSLAGDENSLDMTGNCFGRLFRQCSSLTQAPELPATTLSAQCYYGTFTGCTSLTQAPELPATTLAAGCYTFLFNGCSNLNYIKVSATSWKSANAWVDKVAPTGTFVIDNDILEVGSATGQIPYPSINGIPQGWRIERSVQPEPIDPTLYSWFTPHNDDTMCNGLTVMDKQGNTYTGDGTITWNPEKEYTIVSSTNKDVTIPWPVGDIDLTPLKDTIETYNATEYFQPGSGEATYNMENCTKLKIANVTSVTSFKAKGCYFDELRALGHLGMVTFEVEENQPTLRVFAIQRYNGTSIKMNTPALEALFVYTCPNLKNFNNPLWEDGYLVANKLGDNVPVDIHVRECPNIKTVAVFTQEDTLPLWVGISDMEGLTSIERWSNIAGQGGHPLNVSVLNISDCPNLQSNDFIADTEDE